MAAEACKQMDGLFLTSPRDDEEYNWLYNLPAVKRDKFWIGATDLEDEGTFVFDSDSNQLWHGDDALWASGEGNGGEQQNCIALLGEEHANNRNKYADVSCAEDAYYGCEANQPCFEQDTLYMPLPFTREGETISAKRCADECEANSECNYYIYVPLRRECYEFKQSTTASVYACDFESAVSGGDLQTETMIVDFRVEGTVNTWEECKATCNSPEHSECKSWTFHGTGSDNEGVCVHNYSDVKRKLDVGEGSGIISGKKTCYADE